MQELEHIVKGIRKNNRDAQRQLYDRYKGLLFAICLRYVKNVEDAEEVLSNAFVKIFSKIGQYQGNGSFEGWIKRITVNEALMFLRASHNYHMHVDIADHELIHHDQLLARIASEDILALLNQLSDGYRTIFNLYVVEGYKHREIAEMLGISIHTSKTQLMMAKKRLADLLKKNNLRYGQL